MSRTIRDRTTDARNLIAGLVEGDIHVTRAKDVWMIAPAAKEGAHGRTDEDGLVKELMDLGLLEMRKQRAVPSCCGLRFAGLAQEAGTEPARTRKHRSPKPAAASTASGSPESPLEWLHRRKGPDGMPLLGRAAYEAGERLRAEYTRAGLMPRMAPDLTGSIPGKGRRAGARGPAMMMDAALDARDRVNKALDAVGNELSGLLVDVCCHLKSLGDVERERGWPKRSAKIVLEMGLARLARHYGMMEEAKGKTGTGAIGHWGSEGFRPRID